MPPDEKVDTTQVNVAKVDVIPSLSIGAEQIEVPNTGLFDLGGDFD